MTTGVNNILDCLELNTPSNKRNIEDIIRNHCQLTKENSSSVRTYHLIIDVDTTLERLYGGYYPDWLAGGEWSHLYSYILSLLKTCQELSLCLVFCFDGTLYRCGQSQWYYEQIQQRKKVNQIFKHLKQNKSGLPRRHLWLPPPAFQLCLRTILREINSPHLVMYQTWGNGSLQHQEQIKTYAKQYYHSLLGIVSSDIEFLFSTNLANHQNVLLKYFSSKSFKLSLKGKLSLVEIKLTQLKDKFSLDNQHLSLLLTLLGNHILPDSDLTNFHNDILRNQDFSTLSSRQCVSVNGTVSPPVNEATVSEIKIDAGSPDNNALDTSEDHQQASPVQLSTQPRSNGNNSSMNSTVDQLIPRLVDYIRKQNTDHEFDFELISNHVFKHVTDSAARKAKMQHLTDSYQYYIKMINDSQTVIDSMESSETYFCSDFSSSQISTIKSDESVIFEHCSGANIEIIRTAFNLHRQGLMMPWIFQCLYKHEITFPVTIEPEMCNTIPGVCEFYRPIRKYLYSILLDANTIVREQVYNSEHGSYLTEVVCEQLLSRHIIDKLWFGSSPDEDRQLRMKTFLQSLYYCDLPKIYSVSYDYLLFVCILRYIYMEFFRYSSTSAVLHTYEIMAFISQAVLINELQPKPLMNLQSTNFLNQYDHIQIINYETRPIQLAHLFMRGYETVVFANEVCGAPVHPRYSCPSHFFNGKLFHKKYSQAQYCQQNQDLMMILCDGNAHFAQIGSHLLDVVLDRTPSNDIHSTPIQQQQQHHYIPGVPQQRIMRNGSRQGRVQQTLVPNSTRPPMRTNNKQSTTNEKYNQQPTPISNHRQQQQPQQLQKPSAKSINQTKNNGNKKNNHVDKSFNPKGQQPSAKFSTQTPPILNYGPPSQQQQQHHSLSTEQWPTSTAPLLPANHLNLQSQHQPTHAIHNIQPVIPAPPLPPAIPLQHQQPMNNNFIHSLDEQFVHLQLHPTPVTTTATPIPYSHSTPMMNPHVSILPYSHIQHPPSYPIPNGPAYYHPSSSSANSFPQPLATPYHPHHPPMMPGHPPHAPIAPQRTVNFTTVVSANNAANYQQQSQRLSPNSMQVQELNIQALQQRIIEQQKHQQTPLAVQRQMTRLPLGDYAQYDLHRTTLSNGMPIPVQSCHAPSMIVEHQQRAHNP